jgi:hypothetical protein
MAHEITRIVTFSSTAFNTTDSKDYFINPGCFGDDLSNWLLGELRQRGLETGSEPGQEDFGWYLNFLIANRGYTVVVGYKPDDKTWIGWVERSCGLVASLFGGRKRSIEPAAIETLHSILSESPRIERVRWHFEPNFNRGEAESGLSAPSVG